MKAAPRARPFAFFYLGHGNSPAVAAKYRM